MKFCNLFLFAHIFVKNTLVGSEMMAGKAKNQKLPSETSENLMDQKKF